MGCNLPSHYMLQKHDDIEIQEVHLTTDPNEPVITASSITTITTTTATNLDVTTPTSTSTSTQSTTFNALVENTEIEIVDVDDDAK